LTAAEVVKTGFANGLIDGFDRNKDWFDPSMIPAVTKLLNTDHDTIANAMDLINLAKDNQRIEAVTRREAAASANKWKDPNSLAIMLQYIQGLRQAAMAKKKKMKQAKL